MSEPVEPHTPGGVRPETSGQVVAFVRPSPRPPPSDASPSDPSPSDPSDPSGSSVRREELVVGQLQDELSAYGSITSETSPVDGLTVTEWRSAARRAARHLGRPIRTGQYPEDSATTGAWAMLTDWPATPEEATVHEAAMRRAVESLPSYTPLRSIDT